MGRASEKYLSFGKPENKTEDKERKQQKNRIKPNKETKNNVHILGKTKIDKFKKKKKEVSL